MALESTEISTPPTDEKQFRAWIKQVLDAHYHDIKMLYLATTDYDQVEKLRQENSRSS